MNMKVEKLQEELTNLDSQLFELEKKYGEFKIVKKDIKPVEIPQKEEVESVKEEEEPPQEEVEEVKQESIQAVEEQEQSQEEVVA